VRSARWTRRDLLRATLAGAAAGLLPSCGHPDPRSREAPLLPYQSGGPLPWHNWAGNQACRPLGRAAPASEGEVLDVLTRDSRGLRPVGAGHSFSALVPSDGVLLSTDLLHGIVSIDPAREQAEVWAGTRLHALGPLLQAHGQALPNQPDIDYQALGGAVATSTHGTGVGFGSLSSRVVGLTVATTGGALLTCNADENAEVFHAARCSLGALGIVTRLRLQNQASFELVETSRFEPLEPVLEDIERRRRENRHFEFHAFPHTSLALVVSTNEGSGGPGANAPDDPEAVYQLREVWDAVGGLPGIGEPLYGWLVGAVGADVPVERAGPSFQVFAHDRIARFREMEYTVPAEAGPACLREILATIREREIPVVFPIEYRYVKQDDVWLSMFHDRDGCSISVHQYADQDHTAYFAAIEPIFWKYDGRPHWGKLHTLDATRLAALYPRWKDFTTLREALDPAGRLLNPHLRAVLGVGGARA